MNISRFFIDRPIFASVLSTLIFIMGSIAIFVLPISEYPEVVPPSVVVSAQFPGANPKVLAETVAAPLEEQINGVENMIYMSSQNTSDGRTTITVTFKIGTNPDLAQQLVQNRVSQATPRLPEMTRQLGVTVSKSSPDLTLVVNLLSPNKRYDSLYLNNYALINVKDQLSRLSGAGQVKLFGPSGYAMRLWLNPAKLAERGLTPMDVIKAVQDQNIQAAAGIVGSSPTTSEVEVQLQLNAKGRLQTEAEFADIIIKNAPTGGIIRVKDVARIEMGANDYSLKAFVNNKDSAAIGIFQSPGSNALALSADVRKTMEELKERFPEDLTYSIIYDPTVFVRDSIKSVIHTLLEAVLLVVLVVVVFLQTWRASLIPLIAVPISIIGTFAVMKLLGFSINNLSLFGMVLSIGIVVDDAIVVVENVERNIEKGLSPKEASYKAMEEVSGPIIAIALTLCAVFVPIAFISGLTGQFYRQFALTIAISTLISAFNSLTMSPALTALLLKPHHAPKDLLTRAIDKVMGRFFAWFNALFARSSESYGASVRGTLTHKSWVMGLYGILLVLTYGAFKIVPPGFIPLQDKQYMIAAVQLPDGSTLDRTEKIVRKVVDLALEEKGVTDVLSFPGLSINGFTNSSSAGVIFMTLAPFEERKGRLFSAFAIGQKIQMKLAKMTEAFAAVFPPPPIMGLGTTGGFKLQIEDRADRGYEQLDQIVKTVLQKANTTPGLMRIYSNYKVNVPQLFVDLDRTKAKQMGLSIADIFSTLQVYLGSYYINDFNRFGKTYQVIAQADLPFRTSADDIRLLKARNQAQQMVPIASLLTVKNGYGVETDMRYNGYRTADINGSPAPGYSSGQAQEAIKTILQETLPPGTTFEWTDLSFQEMIAGNTAMLVFPLCVLLVFLVLAAQYESLILPIAIILIVPMCLLCAIAGVWIIRGDNNIFTQISLFVLIGLSCKNAILIVEFAHELEWEGKNLVEAAVEACRLRLRPILMTSFAFIMGVIPLIASSGAGSEMRYAMGIAVFAGMLGVTFFGLFLTPVFYVLLRLLEERMRQRQ